MEVLIRHKDVRILRETLAKLCKCGNQYVVRHAVFALRQYAKAVGPYCKCPEVVFVMSEGMDACLDCGKRSNVKPPEDPAI